MFNPRESESMYRPDAPPRRKRPSRICIGLKEMHVHSPISQGLLNEKKNEIGCWGGLEKIKKRSKNIFLFKINIKV